VTGARLRAVAVEPRLIAALVACLAVGGCGGGAAEEGDDEAPASSNTQTTGEAVGPRSNRAAADFAAWYRAAVKEGGDKVPRRLRENTPGSDEAMNGLIRILCGVSADDTAQRHAAAEEIKDDPEFFGDAAFAASAIVQARIACGLEE
jgi:hypothetical protein